MNGGNLIKYFLIILPILIVLDICFIFGKRALKNKRNKSIIDEYLLNKYSKIFKCLKSGSTWCMYEDEDGYPFIVDIINGKINDNKNISRIGFEVNEKCLTNKIDNSVLSACRVLSFNNYDKIDDFSIKGLLKLKSEFLVQALFIVPTRCKDEQKLKKDIEKIDKQLKDFPFKLFSRSIIFVHPANIEYAEKFIATYSLGDGDLMSFNNHTILIDTKEF